MEIEPGNVVGQRYRLDEPLAAGGMGSVWRATHVKLGTPVAVKFMLDELADVASARSRFEREARAAARLRSPHVVDVVDYGIEEDLPYLAMELLDGDDLATRIKARGRLTPEETLPIVQGVAKALDLAHAEGFLHRDLKPRNIYLAQVAGEEVVKVLDFGLAKSLHPSPDEEATTTGLLMGSPSYMSPEQARGAELDGRSDLWSLAVVVFCAITGKRPFRGKNPGDIIARICADRLPVPSEHCEELSSTIDRFFLRGFARNPDRRFQTGAELAEAFGAAIDGRETAVADDAAGEDDPMGRDEPTGAITTSSSPEVSSPAHGVALRGRPHSAAQVPRHPRQDDAKAVTPEVVSGDGYASLATLSTPAQGRAPYRRRGVWLAALALVAAAAVFLLRVGESSEPSIEPVDVGPAADPEAEAATTATAPVARSVPATASAVGAEPSASASASVTTTDRPPPAPRPIAPRRPPLPRPKPTCDPFSGLCR